MEKSEVEVVVEFMTWANFNFVSLGHIPEGGSEYTPLWPKELADLLKRYNDEILKPADVVKR